MVRPLPDRCILTCPRRSQYESVIAESRKQMEKLVPKVEQVCIALNVVHTDLQACCH